MNISNSRELEQQIEELEKRKIIQQQELVAQFHSTVDSLRPANLIKSSLGKLGSPQVLGTVLKTAGSIGIGLLTNKMAGASGLASSGVKTFLGGLFKHSLTNTVLGNADKIKAYGIAIFNNIIGNKNKTLL